MKDKLFEIKKWIYFICIVAGTIFLILSPLIVDPIFNSWTFMITGVTLLFFGTFSEEIVEFSFGPLKAKLQRNIDETSEIIDVLRKLALHNASYSHEMVQKMGNFGGHFTNAEKEFYIKDSRQILENMGIDQDQIKGIE